MSKGTTFVCMEYVFARLKGSGGEEQGIDLVPSRAIPRIAVASANSAPASAQDHSLLARSPLHVPLALTDVLRSLL